MKIKKFEIINHGYEDSSYFQGYGTAFTDFDYVATGIGTDAKEAYEDALDQLAMNGYDVSILPSRPAGIRKRDKVPAKFLTEDSDVWWRVSIRISTE